MGYFIDSCGYLPQSPFGTDIVEIDGEKPAKLFDQIIDGFDAAVQQLGDIPGKKVDVLNEHAANRNMDDKEKREILFIITDKILGVANYYNDVDTSDLQGIASVEARKIFDLFRGVSID